MGFIREPKGVDFIINSEPLTEKDREEISNYIKEYKAKYESHTRKKSNSTSEVKYSNA